MCSGYGNVGCKGGGNILLMGCCGLVLQLEVLLGEMGIYLLMFVGLCVRFVGHSCIVRDVLCWLG